MFDVMTHSQHVIFTESDVVQDLSARYETDDVTVLRLAAR